MDKDRYHSEEFIEQYLNGELSAEEVQAFEAYLETDETLRKEIDLQKRILEGISSKREDQQEQEIDQLFAESAAYDIDEQIDDYLLGEMTPSWQEHFEAQLATDVSLHERVRLRKAMIAGIREHKQKETDAEISRLFEQADQLSTAGEQSTSLKVDGQGGGLLRRLVTPRRLSIAASVLIIIALGLTYLIQRPQMQARQQSRAALAAVETDFEPLQQLNEDIKGSMGFVSPEDSSGRAATLDQLIDLVEAGDYRAGLQGFTEFTARYGESDLANIYLGILHYQLGDYDSAISHLQPYRSKSDLPDLLFTLRGVNLPATARWYLALSHLQLYEWETARDILQGIRDIDPELYPGTNLPSLQQNAEQVLAVL